MQPGRAIRSSPRSQSLAAGYLLLSLTRPCISNPHVYLTTPSLAVFSVSAMKRKFTTNSRVVNDLFTRYLNTFYAFAELLNNSIQATARNIWIDVKYNDDMADVPIGSISVRDDGHGVHVSEIELRLFNIGTTNKQHGKGIGRFAAMQIGKQVNIQSVAYNPSTKQASRLGILVNADSFTPAKNIDDVEVDTEEVLLEKKEATYYHVVIDKIYNSYEVKDVPRRRIIDKFLPQNIELAVFERYPLQIFNKKVNFHVNGKLLDRDQFIHGNPDRRLIKFENKRGETFDITFTAFKLKSNLDRRKVFITTDNEGVQSVVSGFEFDAPWMSPKVGDWFIYVDSHELPTDMFANLDMELDENVRYFKIFIKDYLTKFFREKSKEYEDFSNKLRKDKFYPYGSQTEEEVSSSKRLVFDRFAYLLEDRYHFIKQQDKVRSVVYPLVDRAISNGDIVDVVQNVLKLEDGLVGRFRSLMSKTSAGELIRFNERVVKKLEDIAFLEKLVYGEVSKFVKERKELHKFLERMTWVFGEQYSDNTTLLSDKSLENNLSNLRDELLKCEPKKKDENLIEDVKGASKSITDLFMYSERIIDAHQREVMVVELKAPRVRLSPKELAQVKNYAWEIEQRGIFPKNLKYTIILVGSDIHPKARFEINSAKKTDAPDVFFRNENGAIEIKVIRWSDLFESLKLKLGYLSTRLKVADVSINGKIEEDFAEMDTERLRSTLKKVEV